MLSAAEIGEISHELAHYPEKRGAAIDALMIVQRHRGWVSDDAIADIAAFLDLTAAELDSVATFYNLIWRKPVGRHVILLCDSVSCWILGYEAVRKALEERLQITFGETTRDGRFTLLPIACLGTCDRAPAMMIDDDTHRDLGPAALDEILRRYA